MRRFAAVFIGLFAPLPATAQELDGRDLIAGETIYDQHCAACHGANLEGAPDWPVRNPDGTFPAPPHDETGHTWHHDNRLLFDYTALGGEALFAARGISGVQSGMPGFAGTLTEDQIWDVLAYIRSSWPDEVRAIQDELNAAR